MGKDIKQTIETDHALLILIPRRILDGNLNSRRRVAVNWFIQLECLLSTDQDRLPKIHKI